MLIAAVQYDIIWQDKRANHRLVEAMLDDANLPADTYVVLPELGDTGFSFDLDAIVDDQSLAWATDLAQRRGWWVQAGDATRASNGRGRNRCSIVAPDGSVSGTYEKVHPFSFGRESEHYDGGDRMIVTQCGDARVCPLICYDLRFPELWRLAVRTASAGTAAEVFTIGASWPDARQAHWRTLLIARAIENQAYVIGVNRTGTDPYLSYAGGSIVVSPMGEVLAEAGTAPAVLVAELDLPALRAWRGTFPALADMRGEGLERLEIDRSGAITDAGI